MADGWPFEKEPKIFSRGCGPDCWTGTIIDTNTLIDPKPQLIWQSKNQGATNDLLTNQDLSSAYLDSANLTGADLNFTDLSNANLRNAITNGCTFTGALFTNTIMPNGHQKFLEPILQTAGAQAGRMLHGWGKIRTGDAKNGRCPLPALNVKLIGITLPPVRPAAGCDKTATLP